MSLKKSSLALALAVVIVPGASACSKDSPERVKEKTVASVASVIDQPALSASVRLDTTPENLTKVMKATNPELKDDGPTKTLIKMGATSTYQFAVKTQDGKNLKDSNKVDGAFSLATEGSPLMEAAFVKDIAYLKADVTSIGTKTGLFGTAEVEQIKGFAGKAAWTDALFSNQWLELDKTLSDQMAKAMNTKDAQVKREDSQKVLDATQKALNSTATFTDQGDGKVLMEVPVRKMLEAEANELDKALDDKSFPSKDKEDMLSSAKKFTPEGKVKVNLLTEKGKLKQARMDVLEFANAIDQAQVKDDQKKTVQDLTALDLPVVLDFSENASAVKVPEKATKVTQKDINSFGGGASME